MSEELERLRREELRLVGRLQQEREASRELARRIDILRPALAAAVEWAAPMAEAPVDSRPKWFDIARSALEIVP